MSEDIVKTLRDISEQAMKSVEAAQSVGDPYQLSASIGRWGELFGQAAQELTRLRAENERLMAMLARIDRVVVFEAHGLGNGFADEVEAILRAARASPAPLAPSQATDGAEGDKASHGPTSEVTAA